VGDLHEVVDLGASLDSRLAHGRTIDGRIRPQLHIVFEDDGGNLRNLLVRAVAAANEAVAIAADDDAVLQDYAIAKRAALANRDIGVDDAVAADHGAGADGHVRIDDGAVADAGARADHDERSDRYASSEADVSGNRAQRVDTWRGAGHRREEADGSRKGEVRVARP
jgi:hypothetical protein